MVKRKGTAKTITVVVPRHGTPAASRALLKPITAEAAKTNRVFQPQESITATELQVLEDASNWNGLLLNARGERGPQWDVTSQMHHVEIGSEEYFDPTLLQEEPEPIPEEESKVKSEMDIDSRRNSVPPTSATQQDVTMASPTRMYQQAMPMAGINMRGGAPVASRYPQYPQQMNGAAPHGGAPMPEHMGGNPMYAQQHAMHMRMAPDMAGGNRMPSQTMYGQQMEALRHHQQQQQQQQQSPQRSVPMGGLSYNGVPGAPPGHNPGMDPAAMGMGGYGALPPGSYPPGMQGGMPGNVPQYPRPGGHNPPPMSGSYGGMY